MPKITLILHNIRSTHNVGSIFRTAEGFGVKEIILSGYTPYPKTASDTRLPHIAEKLHAQIHKTALGAEELVPFRQFDNLDEWINDNKLPILALEQTENSVEISKFKPPQQFALMLGEEVNGIDEKYLNTIHTVLEIPMVGQKESFNVSVATGIALYAVSSSQNL